MHGGLLPFYYAGFYPSLIFTTWPPQLYRLITSFTLTGPKLEFVFDLYFSMPDVDVGRG
jgi:Derlin-2/3